MSIRLATPQPPTTPRDQHRAHARVLDKLQAPCRLDRRAAPRCGRRGAPDLAIQFGAAYQGSAVVTNALAQPQLMARHGRRIERRLDTLDDRTVDDHRRRAP
jgi:hypothetical protein